MAKVVRISALTISSVQSALSDLRLLKGRRGRKQLSESSVAHHARAIKSFSRWLWRDGRVRDDALVYMRLPEVNDKFTRRALDPEEAVALIANTPSERSRAGLIGVDRAILYATALGTGYRLGELCSLTPESFHLGDDPPTIFCEGEFTKNGKEAIQPIRSELAEMLQPWLAGKAPGKPVFVIREDAAAEVVEIWT
jgi:site-specific recombinase XerD